MASTASASGLNPIDKTTSKQSKSKKAGTQTTPQDGRAGSDGGIALDQDISKKPGIVTKSVVKGDTKDFALGSVNSGNKPRRKPRKLNQEPAPVTSKSTVSNTPVKSDITNQTAAAAATAELDALKARVRGLEAKVEELYKSNTNDTRCARSPRRRGKGRKTSSAREIPTISSLTSQSASVEDVDDDNIGASEAEEELVRLEDELSSARRDLELYRPRKHRTVYGETDDVEEIPREGPAGAQQQGMESRQVTLSGSYRIPIPANVSVDDVKNIQSGVTAAQNVARSFLEQRRAARAEQQGSHVHSQQHAFSHSPSSTKRPPPKTTTSSSSQRNNMQLTVDKTSDKQSWGDWIGGYSMAISRAVSKIEHEASMESQRVQQQQQQQQQQAPGMKKTSAGAKRPSARAKLSSEQVHGLMS
ncbi:hypothetical protein ACN47E_002017 [Coniothyrium glycines]